MPKQLQVDGQSSYILQYVTSLMGWTVLIEEHKSA